MQAVKKLLVAALLALALAPGYVLGHGNEKGTATARLEEGVVTVEYMRPTLKGRDVLSLIHPGSYWRLGADMPTTLTTDVALTMGKNKVPAGEYTLVLKFHGDNKWSVMVAEGAARGTWEPQGLVAEVPMMVSELGSSVEALTIKLESEQSRGKLIIEWGTTQMVADFATA